MVIEHMLKMFVANSRTPVAMFEGYLIFLEVFCKNPSGTPNVGVHGCRIPTFMCGVHMLTPSRVMAMAISYNSMGLNKSIHGFS